MNRTIAKVITFVAVLAVTFVVSSSRVLADQTCVQQYGGGVVCGEATPKEKVEHKPVEAGIGDNPLHLAAFLGLSGAGIFVASRKLQGVK